MQDTVYRYILPEAPTVECLRRWLAPQAGSLVPQAGRVYRRSYFDTFDWRLYRKHRVLELDWAAGRGQLRLHGFEREQAQHLLPVERMPAFPAELTASRLRRQLEKICDVRALLPVANWFHRLQRHDFRDVNGKTVAYIDVSTFHDRRDAEVLYVQLSIAPLRGYVDQGDALRRQLEPQLTLAAQQADPFEQLCRERDIVPGGYDARLILALEPDERTDASLGRLQLFLLGVMELNEAGIRDDIDTEFLHDYRVACRRSRTLLQQAMPLPDEEARARFKTLFAELSRVTGDCRDWDVFLLEFDHLPGDAPAGVHDELRAICRDERERARARLLRYLDSARYARDMRDWRSWLERAAAGGYAGEAAAMPIKATADRVIWRSYRGIRKRGRKLKPETDIEGLHELRKRCKKLRYGIEAFRSLYPAAAIDHLIKRLKKLQNTMGAIVDASTQGDLLLQLHERHSLSAAAAGRVQQLIADCDARHARCLQDFRAAFDRFSRKQDHAAVKRLFKPNRIEHADENTRHV
ncbi:CHAD domain-containing protein [Methylohalomonas lacus]|uniref:CHAD domain-containing protein n=1 Tax=Methylohalomonas lacus TaxID=398773 RepID=A0AAE3HIV1_9GAMM|nr:CHAD domain-containing protein [Methylohalomonas lacus]MCS3903075.1 CHAD domain-containing protein [Methylohalomonas lacus]